MNSVYSQVIAVWVGEGKQDSVYSQVIELWFRELKKTLMFYEGTVTKQNPKQILLQRCGAENRFGDGRVLGVNGFLWVGANSQWK